MKSIGLLVLTFNLIIISDYCQAKDVLGCGGFVKSHVDIDFSKVQIKLHTKAGSLKDKTECAPNNGYYFLPLYSNGEYILKVDPPAGWSFEPTEVVLNVDGETDSCSQGKDINFVFKGFGITGKVISSGSTTGPQGVSVSLFAAGNEKTPIKTTTTSQGGLFSFTPVQPGKYLLTASHPVWLFEKSSVQVTVREGNTELPSNSLIVFGYDVTGKVTSKSEPVSGVSIIIFGNGKVKQCSTEKIKNFDMKSALCHVTTSADGLFRFPAVSLGDYKIIPYYSGSQTKFKVKPNELPLTVKHDSVILPQEFEVTGFTISGLVKVTENGPPLASAKVILSGKEIAVTDKNGRYSVDNAQADKYTLTATADDMQFEELQVKISPTSPELPVLVPSKWKVCGKVSIKGTLNHRQVAVQSMDQSFNEKIDTNPSTGEFCLFLAPGKYQMSVVVEDEEKANGLQFFPLQQAIDVASKPMKDINFLQLKATVSGTIVCQQNSNCKEVSVTLKVLDGATVKTVPAKGGKYEFRDVLPGHYEVLIDADVFCWENPSYRITVTSELAVVPAFQQTGYSVTFISSHDTSVEYTEPEKSKKQVLNLIKGSTRHCVTKPGEYTFEPKGCHVYAKTSYAWNTDTLAPIMLTSNEHRHRAHIITSTAVDNIRVKIENNGDSKILGPLKHKKLENSFKYDFEFYASIDNTYVITPISDVLLFTPPSAKVIGENDCQDSVVTFNGAMGKTVSGGINPPLEGVTVKIFGKDSELPLQTIVTKKDGTFSVGPLDGSVEYKVTAEKEGFVISEPNSTGFFSAYKLAEIVVHVTDQENNFSLNKVLLSLSGGESYRKNSMTDDNGKLTFSSLSPGQYYLRPMMKEYHFDPPSLMINVREGESIQKKVSGKRVAFSIFGTVTSLNGEPERNLLVEAQGQTNCSMLQEEAETEDNGSFRIRGLQPSCIYAVRVKPNVEANSRIYRATPSSIAVQAVDDVRNLRFVVFHPISRTDIAVRVLSRQSEHYRSLRVKLCSDEVPDSPIHVYKLDNQQIAKMENNNAGLLVHFPALQTDKRTYFVQLESTLSEGTYKYKTVPIYFESNSSFKYITLPFNAERKVDHGDLNQTSLVALPFIVLLVLAFFNRDKLWRTVNDLLENWLKPAPIARPQVIQAIPIDPKVDDIIVEQIMNINKKKTKPRKA